MTPQLTETLTGAVLHLGIAAFITWWVVRSLRREGRSGWWVLPMLFVAWLFKWYIGLPLIVVCLIWLESSTPSDKTGKVYRFGDWVAKYMLKRGGNPELENPQPFTRLETQNLQKGVAVLGLVVIVLSAGYLTRYQYFKNPGGATVRTNRWTEETDVLSNGGWRVLQSHQQWAVEQWMENHPGEIPPEAKPWFSSLALCYDSPTEPKPYCDVPANGVGPTTNLAGKQWVEKYGHYDDVRGGWLVPVPPDTDVFDGERMHHTPPKTGDVP